MADVTENARVSSGPGSLRAAMMSVVSPTRRAFSLPSAKASTSATAHPGASAVGAAGLFGGMGSGNRERVGRRTIPARTLRGSGDRVGVGEGVSREWPRGTALGGQRESRR